MTPTMRKFSMAVSMAVSTAPAAVHAAGSPIQGVLQDVAITGPQRAMGALVEEVCPGGISRGVILDTPAGNDLAERCTDIVVGVLDNGDVAGAVNGLQQMANEEVNTIGTLEIDASSGQMDTIGTRLQNLRAGGPRVAIAMPGFEGALAADGGAGLLSGGGASADMASRLGVFVNGNYTYNDRDQTSNESGFQSDGYGATAGFDYQLNDPLLVGAAFTYTNTSADIVRNGGSLETDTYGGFGYATYTIGGGWYLDGMAGYTRNDHQQTRTIAYSVGGVGAVNQIARSDLQSDEVAGSLKLGFDALHGAWTVSPYVRFDASKVDIDGYSERMSNPAALGSGLALQIDDQSFTSLMGAIGARFGYLVNCGWGTWYPQVLAEYVHEFDNKGDPITGRFVNAPTASFRMGIDKPDRNFANVGVASSFILNSGTTAFVSFQSLVGYSDLTSHNVEVGVRIPF